MKEQTGDHTGKFFVDCFPQQEKQLVKDNNGRIFPDIRSYDTDDYGLDKQKQTNR